MPATETRMTFDISPEVEVGVFANYASIWHNDDGFILDFAALSRPPTPARDDATGAHVVQVHSRVVARVRIPPSQAWEIMRALEQQLTVFEAEQAVRRQGAGGEPDPPRPAE